MKLNPDCVRDVLLSVETVTNPNTPYKFPQDGQELLKHYSADEVFYHIEQCSYSGFFIEFNRYMRGSCSIKDLSPEGHKFLANIREDTVWNKTKSVAGKIGSKSLDALVQIATGVITQLIKAELGLA